jgi:acyl-CoA synthetase (NDP forming)
MGRKSATYGEVVNQLLEFQGCDAVLAVVGSSAQFHPQLAVDPILAARRGAKPLAVFLTPQAEKSLALLAQAGIAAFRTPEACADAFRAYFSWRAPREPRGGAALAWPEAVPMRGKLDEWQAMQVFACAGVPVVESSVAQAPGYAHALPYPVALKILSAEVAHKSEVGGVRLGIATRQEFESEAQSLAKDRAPLLVQRMEAGVGEAIVGYRDDPVAGPLVLVGAGGILAELYNDVVLGLAPVGEAEALDMIGRVRGFAALRGYRGRPQGDLRALARAVAAMSRLAMLPGRPVREAEANPVVVKESGAVAVDALLVLKDAEGA